MNIFTEIVGNVIGLLRIIIYYAVESFIFGLILNLCWIFLFKTFFNIDLTYFHFVGLIMVIRLLSFKFTELNINNEVLEYEEEVE